MFSSWKRIRFKRIRKNVGLHFKRMRFRVLNASLSETNSGEMAEFVAWVKNQRMPKYE